MFHIFDAISYKGFTGFFYANPSGAFTVLSGGNGWVTNNLVELDTTRTWGEDAVAPSALIQGF